mgnify:CR=1 FL=1
MILEALVDLDNLLILTEPKYHEVASETFRKIQKDAIFHDKNPPSLRYLMKIQREIDDKLSKKFHYGFLNRFPISLIETYKRICRELKIGLDEKLIKQISAEARSPFNIKVYDKEGDLMPGAEETLDFLKKKRIEMRIYTKGEESYQKQKFDYFDLARWFNRDEMIIVGKKKPKDITRNAPNLSKAIFITDSLGDVLVGIRAGIRIIHVPLPEMYHSDHDNNIAVPRSRLHYEFDSLLEFKANYHSL